MTEVGQDDHDRRTGEDRRSDDRREGGDTNQVRQRANAGRARGVMEIGGTNVLILTAAVGRRM